ncbi:LAME_0B04016g1_1 [Lachancea meyersii CBS 8951]|uniref:LAME_0B04016g1_1 n=1 Tax=Lachancea meyersii CBS 8951 TaxID=1266667 RepID=A0A1G4IUU1_9SACH|nr:LAME_0B04016g1_1 [Lachancea meyersii CBS 8951]
MLADPIRSYPRTKFWAAVSDELHVSHGLARNSRQCRDRFNLLFSRALLVPAGMRSTIVAPAGLPTTSTTATSTTNTTSATSTTTTKTPAPHPRSPPLFATASASRGIMASPTPHDYSSDIALESRLQTCVRRFRFGNGRSLELSNNGAESSATAATTPAPAASISATNPILESPPPPPRTGALHELIHPPDSPSQALVVRPEARFADLALIHSQLRHVNSVLDVLSTDVALLKTQVAHLQQYLTLPSDGAKQE